MKRLISYVAITLLCVSCASSQKKSVNNTTKLKSFKESKLANGLKILYVEDSRLPSLSFTMMFQVGSAQDPKSMTGLTALTTHMLEKGTVNKTSNQIASELEQKGMELSTDAGADFSSVSLSALSWDEDLALKYFSEIVMQPAFNQQEINREKKQFLAYIQKKVDDPRSYAHQLFYDYFYVNHPYGQPENGTFETIPAINRKHLISQYLKFYQPSNAWLLVTGKYSEDIENKIAKAFENWKSKNIYKPVYPPLDSIKGVQIKLVNKKDLVQTQIVIGSKGIARSIPEYLEVKVANTILGEGLQSLLVKNVRIKNGLTYNIGSEFDVKKDQGVFAISTFTQNKNVGQTLRVIMSTIKQFYDNGASVDDVRIAKSYLSGNFPQIIETPERYAYNLLVLRLFGVPDTYLTNFQKNIEKVSVKKVNEAIRKYFDPSNLKILLYTNKDDVSSQLQGLGTVEVEDVKL